MDKQDILRMAQEADPGFEGGPDADGTMGDSIVGFAAIERFAALVAAAAKAEEREACIQACDRVTLRGADECIEAIRARGEKE